MTSALLVSGPHYAKRRIAGDAISSAYLPIEKMYPHVPEGKLAYGSGCSKGAPSCFKCPLSDCKWSWADGEIGGIKE